MDGIGSTEISHIFISSRVDDMRPGSTGKLVPGYEARIVDSDFNDVPDGEIGTLLIRGGQHSGMLLKQTREIQVDHDR